MNDQETTEKDCTRLFALDIYDFITAVYRELLEREPDNEGLTTYTRCIYQGMPREAIIYQIGLSSEFAGRFKIKDFDRYKKINKKYDVKAKIKNLPVIGWCIKSTHMPDIFIPDILSKINIMEADIKIKEIKLQEKLKRFDNALNAVIDIYNDNTRLLSEKLDIANNSIAWAKSSMIDINNDNTRLLSEKLDTANNSIAWAKSNTKEIIDLTKSASGKIFERLEKLPETNTVISRFDDLSSLVDVQRIIGKDLSPSYGLESVQAELISILNDKTIEFESYNQIPIEHLVKYAEGKTVAAAYYSQLISNYASDMKLAEIEAAGIEPAQLPQICSGKDTLIIANPTLAALVLISPVLLREIAQKLNRNLVLVVHASSCPISIVWVGFSVIENEEGKGIFRWAQGGHGNWRIRIYNNLLRPVEAKFKWFSDSLCGIGELIASCQGKIVSVELTDYMEVNFNVILQPGGNNIDFVFTGPAKSPGQGKRILAFRIINFSCNIDDMDIDQKYLYNNFNISFLSDDYIRRALHQNGFYDVTSTAYANHGMSKRELQKTRYEYPFDYRVVGGSEVYTIGPDEIVCYNAYRLRKTGVL
jgi:hypothetical protein